MNTTQLTTYAQDWLNENYNLSLNIPIKINNRLSRFLGKFVSNTKQALRIEINGNFIKENKQDVVLDVLKHELVHYAMYELGKPYQDGTQYFENELKRLNVSSNFNNNNDLKIESVQHHYRCENENCDVTLKRNRRINVSRKVYVCGKCGSDFEYLGRK